MVGPTTSSDDRSEERRGFAVVGGDVRCCCGIRSLVQVGFELLLFCRNTDGRLGCADVDGWMGSIYPVDVIKSKLQTDSLDPMKREFSGMVECARTVWRKQGWRGFAGGLGPTLIR